jgi:invasion protein IalB
MVLAGEIYRLHTGWNVSCDLVVTCCTRDRRLASQSLALSAHRSRSHHQAQHTNAMPLSSYLSALTSWRVVCSMVECRLFPLVQQADCGRLCESAL